MKIIIIAFLFFLTNNPSYARESLRVSRDVANASEDAETTAVETKLLTDSEDLNESIESPIPKVLKEGLESRYPFNNEGRLHLGTNLAYACSQMICSKGDIIAPVCACNFNTGKVVTFKNQCDILKHNCRFDTNFKVILSAICPWEFASRRSNREYKFDYSDPKYYN